MDFSASAATKDAARSGAAGSARHRASSRLYRTRLMDGEGFTHPRQRLSTKPRYIDNTAAIDSIPVNR
jgi:hypothetical protein